MKPGETALEVDCVGRADGPVGGKLDGAALDEGSGGHNDLALIAGHSPGLRGHIAVHGGGGLDTLAEGHHGLLAAQLHGLNDVVSTLGRAGHHPEAQLFVAGGGKYGALHRRGHHRGREEQPLVKGGHQPQICAHLLPKARSAEPIRAAVHAFPGAADVAADGGQAASGILNEAPHDHVRPQV